MDAAAKPKPKTYTAGDRVALFVPCYVDLLFPDVGRSVVTLFERLGIPLGYPVEQTCCGQPAFNAGHWDQARSVARHFAETFDGYEWIVVPSGSCAAMCKMFYPMLDPELRSGTTDAGGPELRPGTTDAGGPELRSGTIQVGARVWELSTFLTEALGVVDVGARFPHTLTYHDGCHGRRELKIGDAPLRLLRAVKDATVIELPAVEECCGFGGLFSVKFDELSASMGASKCANVRATGAEVLVSGDSSCLMQIDGLLRRDPATAGIRTMHLAQVLAAT